LHRNITACSALKVISMVRAMYAMTAIAAAKTIHLATFDGAKETTLPFVPVNDPVMGGQSKSSFSVEAGKGVFEGEVKVVPFLRSPGFCNLEAGSRQGVTFPDITGTDGIALEVDQTLEGGLTNWDVSIETETSRKASRTGGGWQADFTFKAGQTQYFVPYDAFTCSSRGRKLSNCGDLSQQLSELTQLGVGSDGVAGPFRLEISSIDAVSAPSLESDSEIRLASFDGVKETTLSWRKTLDPVMGGASTGDFTVADGVGHFKGTCNIVKSLAAPGFAKIEGTGKTLADITSSDRLLLKVRSATPDYQGFKIAFGAPGVPSTTPFQRSGSYKTEFYLAKSNDWQIVEVPLNNFSRDTSDYTGRCDTKDPRVGGKQHYCCSKSPLTPSKDEVCVESKYLSQINDLQIWAEGVEGDFDLELEWIGAATVSYRLSEATRLFDFLFLHFSA